MKKREVLTQMFLAPVIGAGLAAVTILCAKVVITFYSLIF